MPISAQTLQAIGIFLVALVGQVFGASSLGRTNGFLDIKWTAFSVGCFVLSLWVLAVLIKKGFALSIIAPLMAGCVPLAVCLIAIFVDGEAASATKVTLLIVACLMIGAAGLTN